MKVIKQTSPYIRKETSTKRMMIDVLIALMPVVLFSIYRFGFDAIIRILVSLVVMIGVEAFAFGLMNKPSKKGTKFEKFKSRYKDYTINNVTAPAVSAIVFSMIVPSTLPIYAIIIGAVVGIGIVKMFFGGLGSNIFNPAAAGRIFIGIALAGMFVYQGIDLAAGATPLSSSLGFSELIGRYPLKDLFFGNIPGSMGEINALAILIGAAYLLIRKAADFRVMLAALGAFAIPMIFAGLALHPDHLIEYVLYHVLSGGLLFGVVFMITDPVTSPVTRPGRWMFGILIGSVVVLIRLFGAYPEGMAFAILLGNIFVPMFDYPKYATNKYSWKSILGMVIAVLLVSVIVFFGLGGSL
ncbi:MAG: RnfABCDGE type electron transport complex subunit D [Acholeplasmataceae bacterium]